MSTLRLDAYVAKALPCSRADAQRYVRGRHIAVGGEVVRDFAQHVAEDADVTIDGAGLALPKLTLLVMHKPLGVVSSTADPRDRTVIDLVPEGLARPGLAPIGRLDKDATGLLLLTDDGPLLHALTHPRRHVPRTYEVVHERALVDDAIARAAAGLVLADGTRCRPAEVTVLGPGRARVVVHEGKHHQVKRMIGALGGHVTALHRSQFGALALPSDLAEGEVRRLTDAEAALVLGALERATE
jgi:16S rRNA pseudouridine516 synthase